MSFFEKKKVSSHTALVVCGLTLVCCFWPKHSM